MGYPLILPPAAWIFSPIFHYRSTIAVIFQSDKRNTKSNHPTGFQSGSEESSSLLHDEIDLETTIYDHI